MALNNLFAPLEARLAPARLWFSQREPREQLALRVLAVALALVLLVALVWQPLVASHDDARDLYAKNSRLHAWIEDNSEVVRRASQGGNRAPAPGGDWIAQLSRSAAAAGVDLRGFNPEGDQSVRIQIEAQPFADVVNWLQQLETGQGIRVATAEFSSTSSSGLVNLRATLKRMP
ncbi:type II secretion system protein GspM [Alcanivorax sp. 1008]|uniref:type II secretion system protein GspM n=1 Tax=Alcanivorax sp. 1008 TaxID=2816853 RepID=UPI001DFA50EB|nr:type II secretion system protein GspM [Alcanivorax sp. 1008]MCC1498102.1 type II secretion system protein M [Alcanivorax sp. 1008]